ncbi:MAG: hypothetical protein J6B50_11425 [Lachnospiraceae bacterium]|nr:hypothetical protein [Lachnospiraceae bacterium]MBP3595233.1 hypothetical protein [Lachnospiraceae bacterium]
MSSYERKVTEIYSLQARNILTEEEAKKCIRIIDSMQYDNGRDMELIYSNELINMYITDIGRFNNNIILYFEIENKSASYTVSLVTRDTEVDGYNFCGIGGCELYGCKVKPKKRITTRMDLSEGAFSGNFESVKICCTTVHCTYWEQEREENEISEEIIIDLETLLKKYTQE